MCLLACFQVLGIAPGLEAMGGASAIPSAFSAYYNPSLIAFGPSYVFSSAYNFYYPGLSAGSIWMASTAAQFRFLFLKAGLLLSNFSVSGLSGTEVQSLYEERFALVSLACKIDAPLKLGFGLSLKLLNLSYADNIYTRNDPAFSKGLSRYGVTGDLGLFYASSLPFFSLFIFGLSFQNLIPVDMTVSSAREHVPVTIRAGLYGLASSGWGISVNALYREKEDFRFSFGAMKILGPFKIMAGLWSGFSYGVSVGAGYRFKLFKSIKCALNYSNSFSFSFGDLMCHRFSVEASF